jgi:hypothetical protein
VLRCSAEKAISRTYHLQEMTRMTMTMEHTKTPARARDWREDDEPWGIWAGLMVFLNVLVISAMVYGPAGLVAVMVPAAFAMVLILIRIVTEGI